ncbi:MAG TPA: glycogen debranching N-terminal domain-containing protein, partial [Ktedonobacterales bacterium]
THYGEDEAVFTLDLRLDADFSHLFEVKHEIQMTRQAQSRLGSYQQRVSQGGRLQRFSYAHGQRTRQLDLELSQQPVVEDGRSRFNLSLAPGETWRLGVSFLPLNGAQPATHAAHVAHAAHAAPGVVPRDDAREKLLERHQRYRDKLVAAAPNLQTDSLLLRRAYEQSVHDFAALQIAAEETAEDEFIIAAGIPWFMTLFGRDSLIAAYQALPFFPEAAMGTLRALARLQGTKVDKLRAEEPGKILHEYRSPSFTGTEYSGAIFPYYGTIDATPLFLVLLADVCRVTGDVTIARELREHALRALDWMAQYGDRDGDGYIEYVKEAGWGLDNQGWKDSGDAVRYRSGELARPPIALCEVQGYAYAARAGMARVFDMLGEPARAAALRQEANALKERFNRDYWMPECGYYAFGLDGQKRQIDAITSNPGHLLWSGIADGDKARLVAERLVTPELFSGWGVRTLATSQGGYNPISYHLGSVWPHDNSLIVAGLARYGHTEPASRIVTGLLRALDYSP